MDLGSALLRSLSGMTLWFRWISACSSLALKPARNVKEHAMRMKGPGLLLVCAFLSHAAQATCMEPPTGSDQAPALSPPLSQVVTGTGRLQFHSAPDSACPMKGVFVIPKDEVIAYAQTRDGWSSVMYLNPRTGNDVSGWVRSARLKAIGMMGPKQ